MAPTEGRFAMPERRWDCRRGTPGCTVDRSINRKHVCWMVGLRH